MLSHYQNKIKEKEKEKEKDILKKKRILCKEMIFTYEFYSFKSYWHKRDARSYLQNSERNDQGGR